MRRLSGLIAGAMLLSLAAVNADAATVKRTVEPAIFTPERPPSSTSSLTVDWVSAPLSELVGSEILAVSVGIQGGPGLGGPVLARTQGRQSGSVVFDNTGGTRPIDIELFYDLSVLIILGGEIDYLSQIAYVAMRAPSFFVEAEASEISMDSGFVSFLLAPGARETVSIGALVTAEALSETAFSIASAGGTVRLVSATVMPAAVPLPSSAFMLIAALAAIGMASRRRTGRIADA
ncbi:PEP-CTERM sorting domain-containing protein [Jannaschia formosa]|uniref:PEP-CTERM sorting domain-containing protein n=1 Tax=Jannaschia formosa TaxID=2259592 RepID=UPI000E1BDC81|nr:PEP-CTERM sorting domain-containing protein [Jannaschia formosa]TFL15935.1 hypothetical protein DR046_22760 [Jannaschia formosa]